MEYDSRRSRPRQPNDCLACGLPRGASLGRCLLCDDHAARSAAFGSPFGWCGQQTLSALAALEMDDDCLTCGAPPAVQLAHWSVGDRIEGHCWECGAHATTGKLEPAATVAAAVSSVYHD
jgi:hypothetical protein